ncbi:hypothetical protein [Rubrobacter indicoceani]|uniref:hypothetical protein n=1 Tax=Rubrobacter indicoceani TaxID=2051957 RepID=UPI000E5A3974|nr:hypothetical protein [Rubrobacter indicoceani]
MSVDSVHQLQIAVVFSLAFGMLLIYRYAQPDSRPDTVLAFSLLCALISAGFFGTAYLGDGSLRSQVLGSSMVGIAVCTGWSILSIKQANHLWAAEISPAERFLLRSCPYVLGIAIVINLALGMLFPVPVLEFHAEAPPQYVPYKLALLLPETFYVGLSARVFLKSAGPSVQVLRIRLQNFFFALGSAVLVAVGLQAMLNALIRVFAPERYRELLIPLLLRSEFALTIAFVFCFVTGAVLHYTKKERDKIVERFVRWSVQRRTLEHALWELSGPAYRGYSAAFVKLSAAARDLQRRSEEETEEGSSRAFSTGDVRRAEDTLRVLILLNSEIHSSRGLKPHRLIQTLNHLHLYLARNHATSAVSWRIADGNSGFPVVYCLDRDPLHDSLLKIHRLNSCDLSRPNLIAEPQWFQLAVIAAADTGLLDPKLSHYVLTGRCLKERVHRAYANGQASLQLSGTAEHLNI